MGDNGKYPHHEFKINASDSKGHVERVTLRMPPEMLSKIQRVVNAKIYPFENYQEFIRHAVITEFKWMEKDNPRVGNLLSQIEAMNLMMREEEEYQVMEQTYEKMKTVFRKNLALGGDKAKSRNLKLVGDMWNKICGIDDAYWRDLWKNKFRNEYEIVREAAPEAGFGELDQSDMEMEEDWATA